MRLVDELITEYKARDEQTAVVERIARAHERLHGMIQRVTGALAALNLAQAALDFKGKAEEAASSYLSLEARLKALVGTAEDARRKLRMAELVAAPSPLTTKQLADAAVTLEAFRVNSERVLPILGKLSAAMGAQDSQVEMYTRAIGQLAGGHMIEADVRASMGMTLDDFAQHGVKFDKQGALQSSATEALTALEAIVNERFGNILEEMANTPEAKKASLEDAGEKALRAVGMGFLRAQGPLMESATKVLNALVSSGILDDFTNRVTTAITGMFGGDNTEAIARFIAKTLAYLEVIPENVQRAYSFVKDLAAAIWGNIVKFVEYTETRVGLLIANLVKNAVGIENILKGVMSFDGDKIKLGTDLIRFELPKATAPTYDKLPTFGGFKGADNAAEYERRIMAALQKPEDKIPDTSKIPFLYKKQEDAVQRIAAATEQTAKNTEKMDLQSFIFGGGDRAAMGISLADISPRLAPSNETRGPAKLDVRVSDAATEIERAMLTLIMQNAPLIMQALQTAGLLR